MMTETALLGVLWILSVHFHKQREDLLTNKKKERKNRGGDRTELLFIS